MKQQNKKTTKEKRIIIIKIITIVIMISSLEGVKGFYIAGEAPKEYIDGERVSLIVNKLVSPKNLISYPYYSLPFCAPSEMISYSENLGLLLSGDSFHNSPFIVSSFLYLNNILICSYEYFLLLNFFFKLYFNY